MSDLSTLEYWLSHRAPWFIALLIPLYFVAPFLYKLLQKDKTTALATIIIVCFVIALYPVNGMDYSILGNIQFVVVRVPSFVLGMYIAPSIYDGRFLHPVWILLSLLAGIAMLIVTRHPIYAYFFMTIPTLYILTGIFAAVESNIFSGICHFFGAISLESYLWNGMGTVVRPLMLILNIPDYNNLLMYSVVIGLGTLLSVVVHRISRPIIGRFNGILVPSKPLL